MKNKKREEEDGGKRFRTRRRRRRRRRQEIQEKKKKTKVRDSGEEEGEEEEEAEKVEEVSLFKVEEIFHHVIKEMIAQKQAIAQLNMGEGKTAMIMPMLILYWRSKHTLGVQLRTETRKSDDEQLSPGITSDVKLMPIATT